MQQDPFSESLPELPDDLNDFAATLGSFKATPVAVNRDQMMFEAGRAAARNEQLLSGSTSRRALRIWQSAALMLTAVSAGLGSIVVFHQDPEPRVVFVERELPRLATDSLPEDPRVAGAPVLAEQQAAVSVQTLPARPHQELADSNAPISHAYERLRSRQMLIAKAFNTRLGSEGPPGPAGAAASTEPSTRESRLTPRSLMLGEQSRIWMNRLIEEPQL